MEDRFDFQPAPLPVVRRLEAAGFRDWPASISHYDGAWLIRLTASHPAKRLNSINPLDPSDHGDLERRIGRITSRFAAYGRPATFRISPLASPILEAHLIERGWTDFGHSCVMHLNLTRLDLTGSLIHIPTKDLNRFMTAAMKIRGFDPSLRPGLTEIISSIKAETGLFLIERDGKPVSTVIVAHEGDLAGLFEIGTVEGARRKGHARFAILAALKWARSRGARRAWLQVEHDNLAAMRLYTGLGFRAVYNYHYRREPET
jgi:ribosomal protein S18 acetylase RimI-like enzyme